MFTKQEIEDLSTCILLKEKSLERAYRSSQPQFHTVYEQTLREIRALHNKIKQIKPTDK